MSSIPKATKSQITDLAITPDNWEGYPTVDRSVLKSCRFTNLGSSTCIERSELNRCSVSSDNGKKANKIERCMLTDCMISKSYLERDKLTNCTVADVNQMERSEGSNSRIINADKVERSTFKNSDILHKARLERSAINNSLVADNSDLSRSHLEGTTMAKSRVERAVLKECDVTECRIERTNFTGMILKYGHWKNGDLVGRTGNHEVVIRPKVPGEPQGTELIDLSSGPDSGVQQAPSAPSASHVAENLEIRITQTPAPSRDVKDPMYGHEKSAPPGAADTYSNATGLTDEERDFSYDSYNGPDIDDHPPPYDG